MIDLLLDSSVICFDDLHLSLAKLDGRGSDPGRYASTTSELIFLTTTTEAFTIHGIAADDRKSYA